MIGIIAGYALGGAALLAGLFLLNFYRNPDRKIPPGDAIVSPADGKVISIIRTRKENVTVPKGLLGKIRTLTKEAGKDCYVVSIFMSPVDVHYNRAPIAGKVTKITHTPGKFFRAYDLEKSLLNEKNEVVIRGEGMTVKVIQVAGFLARRIRCFVREGQNVEKGQRIGMIALGSQGTLIIPASVEITVKAGQHVKAGASVIARPKVNA